MGVSDVTKYLVFVGLNVVILTCGSTLMAFGAILQRDELKGVKSYYHLSIGGFAIGVGVLAFMIASWGLTALFQRRSCALATFAVLMIIIFIIQIVLGAIALGSVSGGKCEVDEDMEKTMKELFLKQDDHSLKIINKVQSTYHCCGVNGPLWWKRQMRKSEYPTSCCSDPDETCERPFQKGCAQTYSKVIEKNTAIIGGVAIGFCAVELVAAILAWFIRLSFKKTENIWHG